MVQRVNLKQELRDIKDSIGEMRSVVSCLFSLVDREIISFSALSDALLFYADPKHYKPQEDIIPDDIKCLESFKRGISYANGSIIGLDHGAMAIGTLVEEEIIEVRYIDEENQGDE